MNRHATCLALALSLCAAEAAAQSASLEGAVYAMSNRPEGNSIAAWGRAEDGTLSPIGEFATGGLGASFDGGEGLDPLISAYALTLTQDERFLLAVNAGSNTVSAFEIQDDYSLVLTGLARSSGVGPNSIAEHEGLIYVSNIDADGVFNGEPDQEGSLGVMRLTPTGALETTPLGMRLLRNRPSAVQFSTDGQHVVVASINAGSNALASGSEDELVVYRVMPSGLLSERPVGRGSSTFPFNAANRNLPSAIGFQIVEQAGAQFVVVTEAREFQADGSPPAFDALQTGSVSTFRLEPSGQLTPIALDVIAGDTILDGERTACWLDFGPEGDVFFVSNALESTLSSYSFDQGTIELIRSIEASGFGPMTGDPFGTSDGFIDLWVSRDGRFLYQLYGLSGTVGVFEVDGHELTLIQEVEDFLPDTNTQGIVAL